MLKTGSTHQARVIWDLADCHPTLAEALRSRISKGIAVLPTLGLDAAERLAFVDQTLATTPYQARKLGGRLAKAIIADGATDLLLPAQPAALSGTCYDALVIGLSQGGYVDNRFRKSQRPGLGTLFQRGMAKAQREQLNTQQAAISWARDLINQPAGQLGPAEFVSAAKKAFKGSDCTLRVLDEATCRRHGMGCLLTVGAASPRRPRLLVIEYPGSENSGKKRAQKTAKKGQSAQKKIPHLALVGKGVTFDTGGLQIKPGQAMSLMRKDMGGAASVAAAMLSIAQQRPKHAIRAYLPLADNAIDGNAFRPGDVLTAMDGTTVEVGHTDAEGRLLLADALCLARQEGCQTAVTVATLTGAALVALGRLHVPVMGDQPIVDGLLAAAEQQGELGWQLPLIDEHRAMVRGQVADLTNSTGQADAGTITAGAFLQHFAAEVPFAHCDISPASWISQPHDLGPAGATGVWIDTLVQFALQWNP